MSRIVRVGRDPTLRPSHWSARSATRSRRSPFGRREWPLGHIPSGGLDALGCGVSWSQCLGRHRAWWERRWQLAAAIESHPHFAPASHSGLSLPGGFGGSTAGGWGAYPAGWRRMVARDGAHSCYGGFGTPEGPAFWQSRLSAIRSWGCFSMLLEGTSSASDVKGTQTRKHQRSCVS